MASITRSDLEELSRSIEEREEVKRHDIRKVLQKVVIISDDAKDMATKTSTESALTQQSIKNMTDNIAKLEGLVMLGFAKLENKIDGLPSRESHEDNKRRIEDLESKYDKQSEKIQGINIKIASWTASGSILSAITMLIVSHFIKG